MNRILIIKTKITFGLTSLLKFQNNTDILKKNGFMISLLVAIQKKKGEINDIQQHVIDISSRVCLTYLREYPSTGS